MHIHGGLDRCDGGVEGTSAQPAVDPPSISRRLELKKMALIVLQVSSSMIIPT